MNFKSFFMGALCCALLTGCYTLINNVGAMGFGNEEEAGAAQYVGKHDIKDSPYFLNLDVYNMQNTATRVIIPKFKTHQQNNGYCCGPTSANMVVEKFLGKQLHTDKEICKIMGTSTTKGTDCKGMVKYFKEIGWQVESSVDNGSPKDYDAFLKFVKSHLKDGVPIMVENVDWGGHWRVIIGYDSMGTQHSGDDVLILADPFDTSDHMQDGYNIISAERFFYMWFDAHLFKPGMQDKQWLAAKPK